MVALPVLTGIPSTVILQVVKLISRAWFGASSVCILSMKLTPRKLRGCLSLASCTFFELTFAFMFHALSIDHLAQFFREILFDLRMSTNACDRFAHVRAYKRLDFLLDAAIQTPCVDSETLLNATQHWC